MPFVIFYPPGRYAGQQQHLDNQDFEPVKVGGRVGAEGQEGTNQDKGPITREVATSFSTGQTEVLAATRPLEISRIGRTFKHRGFQFWEINTPQTVGYR